MGRYAQAVGQVFEDEILARGEQVDGLVLVKQHPEVKFLGKGIAKVVGKGWADFIGMYRGRSLTFDSKSTKNTVSMKAPEDRKHQFEKLRCAQRYSSTPSFYLVEWRSQGIIAAYMVYWSSKWPFKMTPGEADYWVVYDDQWLKAIIPMIMSNERYTIP